MKTEYQYIQFVPVSPDSTTRREKTRIWSCENVRSGSRIGNVQWYGLWRQYCFIPFANTVYSGGCLADIQDFIKQAMAEHRAKP